MRTMRMIGDVGSSGQTIDHEEVFACAGGAIIDKTGKAIGGK